MHKSGEPSILDGVLGRPEVSEEVGTQAFEELGVGPDLLAGEVLGICHNTWRYGPFSVIIDTTDS